MIGEKFIEKIVDGNRITRVYEFKEFSKDYYELAEWVEDTITDDPEELFRMGVSLSYDGIHSLDCDELLDRLIWTHEEWSESPEDYDMETLHNGMQLLRDASGFTIFFGRDKNTYKSYKAK